MINPLSFSLAEKLVVLLDSTVELGTVISSFFIVLILITSIVFSITSPTTSPIFILSPILKGRIYVITSPAMILLMAEEEPNEINNPKNTDTPWNAGEPEPGR